MEDGRLSHFHTKILHNILALKSSFSSQHVMVDSLFYELSLVYIYHCEDIGFVIVLNISKKEGILKLHFKLQNKFKQVYITR